MSNMRAITRRVVSLVQPPLRTARLLAPAHRVALRAQPARLFGLFSSSSSEPQAEQKPEQQQQQPQQQPEQTAEQQQAGAAEHGHAHGGPGHEAKDPVLHEEFNELRAQVTRLQEEQKRLLEEQKKWEALAKEHKDDWMRAVAEIQTVRLRARQEVEQAKLFGVQQFAKSMLEVADTLRLSLAQLEKDASQTQDPLLKQMYEGIVMTEKVLQQAFERAGIKRLDAVGEPFDPHKHEFVAAVPVDEEEKHNKVAHVVHDGYMLHSRLLRPAKVVSYVKRPKPQQQQTADASSSAPSSSSDNGSGSAPSGLQ